MTQTNDSNNQYNGSATAATDSNPHHDDHHQYHSPPDSVERAFELLSEAKSLESDSEFWKATEVYIQAQQLLQVLSDKAATRTAQPILSSHHDDDNNSHGNDDAFHDEQQQIAKLYSDKAQEYWSQSRKCLIQAMQKEKTDDEEATTTAATASSNSNRTLAAPPILTAAAAITCTLIDDEQAKARNQTFSLLFSRPILDNAGMMKDHTSMEEEGQQEQDSSNISDQQWSIEERLQELNKSLPSGFKTNEERMADINKGLNKLGLSLYAQKQPFARFQQHDIPLPKREEDQIDDIIAQAQDEADFEKQTASGLSGGGGTIQKKQQQEEEDDDLAEDSDDEAEEPGDALLEDDQLAIKTIRKRVVKAQIKIAELVALLDQAKVAKDKEYNNEHKEDLKVGVLYNDSSSEEDLDKSDAATFLAPAKNKLKAVQRDLRKVMEEWNDALVVVIKPNSETMTTETKMDHQTMRIADEDDSDDEAPALIALIDDEARENLSAAVPSPTYDVPNKDVTNDDAVDSLPACPVTILSGFLGSGKTTLVQYILKSPDHGKRIAVIENEFGEGLSVESMIARDGVDPQSDSLQDLIELPNGCICCTVKDSLVTALESLLEKRQDLDYILIEASGMANPGPIASVFWLDDALESRLKLDGIVTLVDGVNILEQLESTEEAAQQIAYADRIVLNKVDILGGQQEAGSKSVRPKHSIADVERRLRELHPTAPILRTSFSKIPNLDWILNADCFGGADRLEELENVWESLGEWKTHSNLDHSHDHHHNHTDSHNCLECQESNSRPKHESQHRHTASISTIALHQFGSVNLSNLNAWLADILWPNQDQTDLLLTAMLKNESCLEGTSLKPQTYPKESETNTQHIYRIKGVVSAFFRDEDRDDTKAREAYHLENTRLDRRRFILQAVHDLWEVYPASDDLMFQPNEERVSKVVVIGKFLREAELRSGFQSCFLNS